MKEQKKQIDTNEMYKYYDRDEACDKTISTKKAFDYYDYRIGSKGGFTEKGYRDANECQQVADTYQPAVIYQSVLSFDKDFAIKNSIVSKNQMELLVRKSMPSMLKELGFDPKNIEWTAFYHTNTEHPHIHISFFEKEATRKQYRLPKKKLDKARSVIVSKLELNINLYMQKDERLHRLMDTIEQCELDTSLLYALSDSINNSLKIPNDLKPIIDKMVQLEHDLPKTKSMKYNSKNIRPYHDQIREIIHDLYRTESIQPFFDQYKQLLDEIKELQIRLYGTGDMVYKKDGEDSKGSGYGAEAQECYYKNRMYELETRVGNLILRNIMCARNDIADIRSHVKTEENKPENKDIESNPLLDRGDVIQIEKIDKSIILKDPPKRMIQKHMKIRTNNIRYAVAQEMSQEIANLYYASVRDRQKIQAVTQRAKQDIYYQY